MSIHDWDLRHFRLLDALARSGSIGEAARTLSLAQPNASRLLESMERSARFPLVVRSPRGSRLTDRGLVLAGLASEVLAAAAQLGHAVEALAEERGTLRVCASLTVAEHLMPAWLATARQQLPSLTITLDVGNSASVFGRLQEGTAELGFVEGPTVRTGHRYLDVMRDDLLLVVPPSHSWAAAQQVDAAELLSATLVVREEGSGTRQVTDQALARLAPGGSLPSYLEVGSNAALVASVVAGLGPGVVSRLAVAAELSTGRLVEVRTPGLRLARSLRAVWPARTSLSPDGESFLRLIQTLSAPGASQP
ncbi:MULTISPECIES: LysR family transcriptional regulator [Arthrobacter]|uniref:LysR family transcriptional regulator n=2 Tax=Arthrobacter TaxID=1663 RepID=A0ABU9KHW3_9MICC|nr:LysR family transcriptional regulator [Arthrobacter sp. YJM1]MDP5225964.1 LysR family transcriptional regulator [Arthrobacter sp. YJM1]